MFPHKNIKTLIYSFENHKIIYFRVPKVASTSILKSLREVDNLEKVEEYDKTYFKFAFVRNPYDRLASCFRHVIQKGVLQNIQEHPDLHRNMSFKEFVNVISKIKIENMDIHFRPQYTFILDKPNYLGKFESLNEDFTKLSKIMGIRSCSLLHENKTNPTHLEDYYDEETRKKVYNLYKKDFEQFGYKKDL